MIFLLIAGTFTPLVVVLEGSWRIGMLVAVWIVAAVGILQKAIWPGVSPVFSVALATSMGWLALLPLGQWAQRLGWGAVALTIAGGVCYISKSLLARLDRKIVCGLCLRRLQMR